AVRPRPREEAPDEAPLLVVHPLVQVAVHVPRRVVAPLALARGRRARAAEERVPVLLAHEAEARVEVPDRRVVVQLLRRVQRAEDVAGALLVLVPVGELALRLALAGREPLLVVAEPLARVPARALGHDAGEVAVRDHAR